MPNKEHEEIALDFSPDGKAATDWWTPEADRKFFRPLAPRPRGSRN